MCLIIAFRGISVGTDTLAYSQNFNKMTGEPKTWQRYINFNPGFGFMVYLFKSWISDNPMDCWGLMGVFYVLSFYIFARKFVNEVNVAVAMFVLCGSYLLGFNIIRQCFALSVVLCIVAWLGMEKLTTRRIVLWVLSIVLTGYLFHPTMMILIVFPLYHTSLVQWMMRKKVLVFILFSSFAIFVSGVMVDVVLFFLGTTDLEGGLISYMSRVESEESGYSVVKMALITGFHLYTIIVSKNVKSIFLFMGTMGIVFLNVFGVIVIEFVRIYEAFMVFGIIYYAQMLTDEKYKPTTIFYKPILIGYVVVSYLNIIIKGYGEITPYVFR